MDDMGEICQDIRVQMQKQKIMQAVRNHIDQWGIGGLQAWLETGPDESR
jgi:hypothetical protein